ncbi:hypothetical protein MNBD_BACTEROID05-1016 [hydrothermal vent metagenome]|uniref:Lysozyme inhibitor LprI-like N-terminal domain-containing protein n=1 Tax=hydrothermal vent metagenome TaxID=652676 RepID=A0A3B0TNZ5_9ZZZZ
MEKLGFVILGVILSGIAYLIKRWVEGKPQVEALDKHKKILEIHKQMNEQGLDVDGLKDLEALLTGKAKAITEHSKELTQQTEPLVQSNDTEDLTQLELNKRAREKFEKAKIKLQEVIAGIDSRVGDKESQALMNSQRAWESYSVDQAQAVASSYEGGSIYNLIYLSELESLTIERTARLQAELDELIRMGN